MGGGEPVEEAKQEDASAISTEQNDVATVMSKNISIVPPVSGTITSGYGARDEILQGVGTYHTGIDIANKLNTEIHSATEGTVVKTEKNNKYYGNNIEIEKDGIIFKYGHLNSIDVNQGDTVTQGQLIGHMGSTGMSTGSHLHFEIKVNSRTVNPAEIVSFQ